MTRDQRPRPRAATSSTVVLTLALLAASSTIRAKQDLGEAWSDRPITINAKLDDWNGRLVPSKDAPLSIGAVNDGDFLYLALSSSDEQVARNVFHHGLIVWIRPKGGTDVGIEFPLGTPDPHGGHRRAPAAGAQPASGSPDAAPQTFILLEADSKDGQRISVDNPFGLEMQATLEGARFAYELKVPLRRSALHPYCLDADPGAKLTLEIETREPESVASAAGPRGGTGGGSGGGHHQGGGMGGGMGGENRAQGGTEGGDEGRSVSGPRSAPVKVKAKAQLAAAPASR